MGYLHLLLTAGTFTRDHPWRRQELRTMGLSAEERRYKISPARICAHSYVNEKDLPEGQKLLTCGRCRETCYISKEAQIEHWRSSHRYVCCEIQKDDIRVRDGLGYDNSMYCIDEIHSQLANRVQDVKKGRSLLYAFQQLMAFASNPKENNKFWKGHTARTGNSFEDAMKELFDCILPSRGESTPCQKVARLWAIPNFTNFFLAEDIFLSSTMKQWKIEGIPAPRKKDVCSICTSLSLNSYQQHPSLTALLFRLHSRSALDFGEARSGQGGLLLQMRATKFGMAIERLNLESWRCPYSRASICVEMPEQSGLISRSNVFWGMFMGMYRDFVVCEGENGRPSFEGEVFSDRRGKRENEIMSGLTVKQLYRVMLDDEDYIVTSNPRTFIVSLDCLDDASRTAKKGEGPWDFFTSDDRLELLDMSFEKTSLNQTGRWNETQVALLDQWRLSVLGLASESVFGVYDTMVSQARQVCANASEYIRMRREELLMKPRLKVQEYLNSIEPQYLTQQSRNQEVALPFPDELIDHIGCYLAAS